ncbi:hypothetical protein BJF91_04750 [Allorhizobium taibaishanense]|uniref:Uncharacterized protein n=1 Tax=Allorhizobium taibaishanense TaxID=887144 RepID=A0A1Q8ZZT5_9HYPH|nr:hypothetical protein BJF91_04750 [Allorhizobium taibaishanense]
MGWRAKDRTENQEPFFGNIPIVNNNLENRLNSASRGTKHAIHWLRPPHPPAGDFSPLGRRGEKLPFARKSMLCTPSWMRLRLKRGAGNMSLLPIGEKVAAAG